MQRGRLTLGPRQCKCLDRRDSFGSRPRRRVSFSPSRRAQTLRPSDLRRELNRILDRLGLGDDPGALRGGVPLRDAPERLGVDTAPLDLPRPPEVLPPLPTLVGVIPHSRGPGCTA